ncbi:hypothetical protein [Polaromonas sp.]|uniref:hypothetical protein n=1 Tax=Polaromonas sp. TaxID=1869339 RepID=UPI0032672130
MKHVVNIALALVILLAIACLSACKTVPLVTPVNVAIPVECKEPEPDRPVMPTDALKTRGCPSGGCVDELLQSSLAENQRREGYEVQLVTALRNCKRPITP